MRKIKGKGGKKCIAKWYLAYYTNCFFKLYFCSIGRWSPTFSISFATFDALPLFFFHFMWLLCFHLLSKYDSSPTRVRQVPLNSKLTLPHPGSIDSFVGPMCRLGTLRIKIKYCSSFRNIFSLVFATLWK